MGALTGVGTGINKNTFEGGAYLKGGAYWKEGTISNHCSISFCFGLELLGAQCWLLHVQYFKFEKVFFFVSGCVCSLWNALWNCGTF